MKVILVLLAVLNHQQISASGNPSTVVTFDNLFNIVDSNELVLLNFYSDLCRFSIELEPIFEAAAAAIQQKFPEPGRVFFGKINCIEQVVLDEMFAIMKYPTLKILRHGMISKQEYRGQRSVDGFIQFVQRELEDPIKEFHSIQELQSTEIGDGLVVGCFMNKDNVEYDTFRKAASLQRNYCRFTAGFGDVTEELHPPGQNLIIFLKDIPTTNLTENYSEYSDNMSSIHELNIWIERVCMPLVRELSFDNAEELSEEEKPFLLLFHNQEDLGSILEFKAVVNSQLANERRVIYLTAKGKLFIKALLHIGKTLEDLPVIAIDSFRHMYVFPRFEDIHQPGVLKQFIEDLFNEKLHHNFHRPSENNIPSETTSFTPVAPESKFKDLKPSKLRYSLKERTKDEL
ncbi:hypothetical protein KR009_003255 [Drosophila setifemur]|nr:hypothetical protein KR009_003255 [Drosophila setifemur]